jgi:DNA polymerase III alpha subunit
MLKPFVPLHVKSDHSFGRAVGSPTELAERAHAIGVRAMALTDAETLAGQVEFHEACRAWNIKAITGAELWFDSAGLSCVVALARNVAGYRSLCRLITDWHRRPERARTSVLTDAPDRFSGLFVLTDDPEIGKGLRRSGVEPSALGFLLSRPHASLARERALREAAATLRVALVADLDVEMPCEGDGELHRLRVAIHERTRRTGRIPRGPPRALSAKGEELFADVPEALREAHRIAEECELDLLAHRPRPFSPAGLDSPGASRLLAERCGGAIPTAAYASRLRRELDVIRRLDLSGYFLAVAGIADEARRRGISLVARGSAVSSLVVARLGLSTIDPIEHGLYFERFLRAGRRDPPDIDLDVSYLRREELMRWTETHFGPDRVCAVSSYQTFQRRSAYREALAVLGMSPRELSRFSAALPDDELPAPSPRDLLPGRFAANAPVIERLVGRPHHLATHPSALVVSGSPILDVTPLVRAPKGRLVTQYDGESLGRMGLVKIDLLGNRALAELEEIGRATRTVPLSFPAGDPRTIEAIGRADTVGCHQLESPTMRSLLQRLPIASLGDVMAAVASIRPGAGAGPAKEAFIRRARGQSPVLFPDPRLKHALEGSLGVLLYEEDVIRTIAVVTGRSVDDADELRARLVRGEEVGDEFVELAGRNGFDRETAVAIWENVARFAAYSFSKAHAASVAELAYQSAFAKTHHAPAFAAALLNHHGGLYPLRTLAAAMSRDGVELRGPDVNASVIACVSAERTVRIGLEKLKHVGAATKQRLLEERAVGPFHSLADFRARVAPSPRELEAFVLSGACDGLSPLTIEGYPFAHRAALGDGRPEKALRALARPERVALYRALVRVQNELRFLEMHPSHHPMALLRDEATRAGCLSTRELSAAQGERVRFAGIVAALRRIPASGGGVLQYVTFEDEHGLVEAVVPPPVYGRLSDPIKNPGPYLVGGLVGVDARHVRLHVDIVAPFHLRDHPYAA